MVMFWSSSSNTSSSKTWRNIKMIAASEVVVKQMFCIGVNDTELFLNGC